jgi:transcriptional regulator with XRE-family HTH domain
VEGDLQWIVGQNLRAYREARGLSQEGFAEVIGYHRTYVGGLERGERNLTLKAVERIAERLSIDVMDLLT